MGDGESRSLQIRIGAFILAGLGVFLAIVYLLGAQARYFERKYHLIAEFTEVGGLIPGATVRLAGVQIGRVTEVTLPPEPGGKVKVTLTIARRFADRIRRNSEARISTQGLLGDKLIEITLGDPSQPRLGPGERLVAQEPLELGRVLAEGTGTLASVNRLAGALTTAVERVDRDGTLDTLNRLMASLGRTAERLEQTGSVDDLSATVKSARRITREIEQGSGFLHAMVYGEPETLRRLNALLASAQDTMDRARTGDNAVSVFLSPESARGARSLLAAMDAIGRGADKPGASDGLLPTLLFDPQYRAVADDLRTVARNFREVSEKLANGQGLLGELVGTSSPGPLGRAAGDFEAAMANLRAVSDRLKAGDGTLGALLEDPTVYEKLVQFLDGAQRSFLLRSLMRRTIGGAGEGTSPRGAAGSR